jgi:hypothetical protein
MLIQISTRNIIWPDQSTVESHVDYNISGNSDLCVFIYGHPFDPYSKTWISAEWVLNEYENDKLDFVSSIEGIYSIIIHDSIINKRFVISDRYGIYSLFYFKDDNNVKISDDLQEIARELSKFSFNEYSIIEFLNFGFKLGTKTHIDGIYEFDSARIYEINGELEISERIYWEFSPCSSADLMSKEEFRHVFNAHVDLAMSLNGHICFPLSGGIDTRMMLSACLDKKNRFHCFTYGVPESRDIKVADKICRHYRIDHNKYFLTDSIIHDFPNNIYNYSRVFNGNISTLMFLLHNMISYEEERKVGDVLLSGVGANEIWRSLLWHWGTRWDDQHADKSNTDRDVSTTLFDIFSRNKNNALFKLYKNYSYDEIRALLINSILSDLNKAEANNDAIQKCCLFMFKNYLGNVASNVLKFMGKQLKIFPVYLHKDLLLQISHFPLAERNTGQIQKYVISKNSRYLSNILANNGVKLSNSLVSNFKRSTWLIKSKIDGIANRLFIGLDLELSFHSFIKEVNYSEWTRQYSKTLEKSILDYVSMKTSSLFLPHQLDRALLIYQDGDNSLTSFFSNLMSFELWVKSFNNAQNVSIT